MLKLTVAVLCAVFLSVQEGSSLPQYFKKCNESLEKLSDCLTSSANKGWSEFVKGSKKYNLLPLQPLHIPYMHINVDDHLLASGKNVTIDGLESVVFKNISIDFVKNRCTIEFDQPMFKLNGTYLAQVYILNGPFEGEGSGMITFEKAHNVYYFDYELAQRYEQNFIYITHSDMDMKIEGAIHHLDSLLDGNQTIIDNTNKFLNDNWKTIFNFLKEPLGSIFAQTYSEVLQSFFDKYPTEDFFNE